MGRLTSGRRNCFAGWFLLALLVCSWNAAPVAAQASWKRYFERQVELLENRCLRDIEKAETWLAQRDTRRRELQEMLGLYPWPERTPLNSEITGTHEKDDIIVENLHFQAMPGLYVTANLYRPREIEKPLPAILYVCGHGRVVVDDVSHGNKTYYQHHGAWFARHGYVCLAIDTVQLGEIEGIHHGTYRYDMWWWQSRGYTPAGVEAWNGIRALDYLQSRPEVDGERIGMTGRSGGGAYTWWVAALDDRVKVAVPVAGITNLREHVVNDCIEGHCDCMFFVNTYRWDFPLVAALVAPRPMLIANSDKDSIFPLDGVMDVYWKTRKVYELLGASDKLGLNITEGPHKDTQELRIHAFRWFNRFLKEDDALISVPAEKQFETAQLKVFQELPQDQRNTTIHETFVAAAETPPVPTSVSQWKPMRDSWFEHLRTQTFRGWPATYGTSAGLVGAIDVGRSDAAGLVIHTYRLTSEPDVSLSAWLIAPNDAALEDAERIQLQVLGPGEWSQWGTAIDSAIHGNTDATPAPELKAVAKQVQDAWQDEGALIIAFAPRGVGPDKWTDDEQEMRHIRRRFHLIGQTWHQMQVWDVCQAIRAIRQVPEAGELPLTIAARGDTAGVALYAALAVEPVEPVDRLELTDLPTSHASGPVLINVLKGLDLPQTVAMVAQRSSVRLTATDPSASESAWQYVVQVREALGWPKNQFHWTAAEAASAR